MEQFNKEWATKILRGWWDKNEHCEENVQIIQVKPTLNSQQGLLSTTYVVDVIFQENKGEEETKSLFAKIPLRGPEAAAAYDRANRREFSMFTCVLPQLQTFLDNHCQDILRLPIPEIIYCNYTGDQVNDVFVLENLLDSDFNSFGEANFTQEYLKSCLECLAQLHGTGLAFKLFNKGKDTTDTNVKQEQNYKEPTQSSASELKTHFPDMQEQSQIKDVLEEKNSRKCIRRNFAPFLKYLETQDPSLSSYTGYLGKMEKNLFKMLQKCGDSGISKLVSLCHGDSKPDNFMFRRIEIDLDELSCEGLEGILIDWQASFIGSVSNDLMWLLPPFIERQKENECTLAFALDYYYNQLRHVLESFGRSVADLQLEDDSANFQKILRCGFLLEFFSVVIINPIMTLSDGPNLRRWHRKMLRHQEKLSKGGKSKLPVMPDSAGVFPSDQFPKFANLYFKVAQVLGVFQEMGTVNVDIVRERMFREEGEKEDEEENDDIYEDEEDPLTEEEEEVEEEEDVVEVVGEDVAESPSAISRLFSWLRSLLGLDCRKGNSPKEEEVVEGCTDK